MLNMLYKKGASAKDITKTIIIKNKYIALNILSCFFISSLSLAAKGLYKLYISIVPKPISSNNKEVKKEPNRSITPYVDNEKLSKNNLLETRE